MWFRKKENFPYKAGLIQAVGIVSYITLFTILVTIASKYMPGPDPAWAPFLFLTIFCFSVMACGIIVFYKPYLLFVDDKPKEAGELVLSTAKWLGVFALMAIIFAVVMSR